MQKIGNTCQIPWILWKQRQDHLTTTTTTLKTKNQFRFMVGAANLPPLGLGCEKRLCRKCCPNYLSAWKMRAYSSFILHIEIFMNLHVLSCKYQIK